MSDEIPYAHPFPWGGSSTIDERNQKLRKRKFVGSGLAVLRKEMGSESKLGNLAKTILINLSYQHGIEIDGEIESDAEKFKGLAKIQLGTCSFFVELLKVVIESGDSPISTRHILKKVCLLLQPGTLPGNMDSKDLLLAALHFLSSKSETKSIECALLPLIRSEKAYGDLERRNFVKVGDWKLEDTEEKLLKMEELFLSSPSSWKWQKRESLSLRLTKENEAAFFMKGTIPLCATSKKVKGGEGGRKRIVAIQKVETSSQNSVVEASIDDTVINHGDSIVEAIILDELLK